MLNLLNINGTVVLPWQVRYAIRPLDVGITPKTEYLRRNSPGDSP